MERWDQAKNRDGMLQAEAGEEAGLGDRNQPVRRTQRPVRFDHEITRHPGTRTSRKITPGSEKEAQAQVKATAEFPRPGLRVVGLIRIVDTVIPIPKSIPPVHRYRYLAYLDQVHQRSGDVTMTRPLTLAHSHGKVKRRT